MHQVEHKDLRKMLERLFYLFKEYRKTNKVIPIRDLFEVFKTFKNSDIIHLDRREIDILRRKMMDHTIQDRVRSTKVEKGNHKSLFNYSKVSNLISNVKHEKRIGNDNLKPDIYFETGSQFDRIRKITIEVKIYRKGKSIPSKEVRKTHSLLESGDIDYLLWYSNVPLNSVKFELDDELKSRVGRIQELTEEEIGYGTLLAYQDDLFSQPITDLNQLDILLSKAGLDIEKICEQVSKVSPAFEHKIKIKTPLKDILYDDETSNEGDDENIEEKIENNIITSDRKFAEDNINSKVLKEILNHNTKKFVYAKTIIKNLKIKNFDLEEDYTFEEAINIVLNVSKINNFKTTPTIIYF